MLTALSAHFGWSLSLIDVTAALRITNDPMHIRMKSHWFRNGCKRVLCTMYGLKEASMQFY